MNNTHSLQNHLSSTWQGPLDLACYDCNSSLLESERAAIEDLLSRVENGKRYWYPKTSQRLQRLVEPLRDVFHLTGANRFDRNGVIILLLKEMHHRCLTFWAWSQDEWVETICHDKAREHPRFRIHLMVMSYFYGNVTNFHSFHLPHYKPRLLAIKIFGSAHLDQSFLRINHILREWGYGNSTTQHEIPNALCEIFLANRSPFLEDVTSHILEIVYQGGISSYLKQTVVLVSRTLVSLGILRYPLATGHERYSATLSRQGEGVPPVWFQWCQRWLKTSTQQPGTRKSIFYALLKVGRWLEKNHPDVLTPADWTRELAASFVAAVMNMRVGEWITSEKKTLMQSEKPLAPRTRKRLIGAMNVFIRDCQEWEWISCRFHPGRSFALPRSLRALIGPDPRIIADDVWAKLLWAGLNLGEDDLPIASPSKQVLKEKIGSYYPLELVRAVVLTWLFAGLRSDEIYRLRVGCVRWQREDLPLAGTDDILPKDSVCWLDIPVNKTSTAFTKAVDRIVGEAIFAWEKVRPTQPSMIDPKTSEIVDYLFFYRGKRLGYAYLNNTIIPLLCRKGGVPLQDARGNITSHRARSTIASQLASAKEPMSLLELQEWLGHETPESTRHYVKHHPTKLAKAYMEAGYFGRNLRAVEVLIDQDVIKSGAVATGIPWRYYDLGHGYCTYEFFDQCPHRMACAKCAFYCPKESSQAQLLEAKNNLLRLQQEIPLSEEERAAIEDGVLALDNLCARLATVPTPAGPTPQQLTSITPPLLLQPSSRKLSSQ